MKLQSMQLVHVFPTFAFGGQQVRLAALINGLGPDFRHRILSLSDETEAQRLIDVSAEAKVVVHEVAKSSFINRRAVKELSNVLHSEAPDIVCTYNWGSIEAVVANRLGPKRSHIHFEDGFGPDESIDRQNAKRVLFRRLMLRKSVVVTPSRVLEKLAVKNWRLPAQNIRYIANGVSIERFTIPDRRYDRSVLIIGSVGALRPEKNFSRLFRAFHASEPEAQCELHLVGDGPEADLLRQEAASSSAHIELPGATQAPEKAYASFDIFAMSSDTEQMPLSLIEAMAAGLPVVATDVGDIRDMVSEENKRFITPRDDEPALAASLKELAADQELRERLGRANARKAAVDYSLTQMVERYDALFRSVAR